MRIEENNDDNNNSVKNKGNKVFKIVPITVVLIVVLYYFFGWNILAWIYKDKIAYDMESLTQLVSESIDQGKSSGLYLVSGLTETDVITINDYLCSLNGGVAQYSILEKSNKGMRVKFKFDISDNYYVWQKYLNGKEIPNDRPRAKKLYSYVVDIIDMTIKPEMSDYEKELAIHDYIVTNCRYGYDDLAPEYAYRAYGALVQKIAVCNGYTEAMALLLTCAGVENGIVTGSTGGVLHAWNQVKIDGEWYHVDSTWDDPKPDRGSLASHQYFNVTNDFLRKSHNWKEENFNICTATLYNYYDLNGYIGDMDKFKEYVRTACENGKKTNIEMIVTDYAGKTSLDDLLEIPGLKYYKSYVEPCGENKLLTLIIN